MPIPQPAAPAPQDRPRQRVDAIGNKALRLRRRPARQCFLHRPGCTGQGSQRGHTPPGPPCQPTVRGPPPGGGHPPPGAAALIGLEQGRAEQVAHLGGGESDLTGAGHRSTADRPAPILNDAGRAGSAVQVRPPSPVAATRRQSPRTQGTAASAHPRWSLTQVRSIRNEPASAEFRGGPGHPVIGGADRSPTPRTIA
jgi:hypothetical protein